jgi:hypothetical protein
MILRGIANIRDEAAHADFAQELDTLLDEIPHHSPHLLIPETNSLFYLKAIRFRWTEPRAQYLRQLYDSTRSETVKRACIECRCEWKDRPHFTELRNQWNTLSPEAQRMLWLGAKSLGDEGKHFRKQVEASLANRWRLGFELDATSPSFASLYAEWA